MANRLIMGQPIALAHEYSQSGGPRSIVRAGSKLAAIGQNVTLAVVPVGKSTVAFRVSEAGWLQALTITFGLNTAPTTAAVYISRIIHNLDQLISGDVPSRLFAENAFGTPQFANFVEVADILQVDINNLSGAPLADLTFGWTVAPRPATNAIVGSAIRPMFQKPGFRTIVAVGATDPLSQLPLTTALTVPAGGTLAIPMTIKEPCVLDRLLIDAEDNELLNVVGLTYDNQNMMTGVLPSPQFDVTNTRLPRFGVPVLVAHELTVTVANSDIVPRFVAVAYTAL